MLQNGTLPLCKAKLTERGPRRSQIILLWTHRCKITCELGTGLQNQNNGKMVAPRSGMACDFFRCCVVSRSCFPLKSLSVDPQPTPASVFAGTLDIVILRSGSDLDGGGLGMFCVAGVAGVAIIQGSSMGFWGPVGSRGLKAEEPDEHRDRREGETDGQMDDAEDKEQKKEVIDRFFIDCLSD